MNISSQIRRTKKKRLLVLCAGSLNSGIHGIYLETTPQRWHILANTHIPYSCSIKEFISNIISNNSTWLMLSEAAWFDRKLSHLFLDCSHTLLASVLPSNRHPSCVILSPFELWKGIPDPQAPEEMWLMSAGSAHFIAASLGVPVFTGFSFQRFLSCSTEYLPLRAGIIKIALQQDSHCAFINLGVHTRLFVVDRETPAVVVDREAVFGMHLINIAATEYGCSDGFDRDGCAALAGSVDKACADAFVTEYLAASQRTAQLSLHDLTNMYHNSALSRLSPADRLATITAVTARLCFLLYKKECPVDIVPTKLWISGGGSLNQTLRKFLETYFHSVQVRAIDELGIPPHFFFPTALGLSVHTWLDRDAQCWHPVRHAPPDSLGAWVVV